MKNGILKFILSNVGSKSERVAPYLEEEDGTLTEVYMEGDDPFENASLKEYDGKAVSLTGEENELGLFVIEKLTALGDGDSF